MKFSIVIPTYNHCDDLLRPCIESIQKWSDLSDTEIVVVANGCTDNTLEYVKSLPLPVRLIWSDQALGYTKAANLGLRSAHGDYIILLNNDTEILPSSPHEWINRLHEPFITDDKMAVTGSLELFDHDVNHTFLVFCCVMISRSALTHLGYLDESFSPGYGEDIDFCMRALDAGWKFQCIDKTQFINGTNVGNFPLWHKGNKTFGEMEDYSSSIVVRNQKTLRERYLNRTIGPDLQDAYNWALNTKSDIYQHIGTLRRYARQCDHITELGTRHFVSFYGFAAGRPKKIVTYDIDFSPYIDVARPISVNNNVELVYKIEDTRTAELEPTDLIFFDTLHTYDQLKAELTKHAELSRKYLVFHDTSTFADRNEFSSTGGIWPAIQEFLDANPHWKIKEKFDYCNGLTVVERVNPLLDPLPEKKTSSRPKYSIIIPTYNHCDDLLRPCVESICRYTDLNDIELIVVANGCTDNTKEYVENLGPWARLIWADEPLGYPRAVNLGIKVAQGEFIVLLNNDTELLPQEQNTWLNMLAKFFSEPDVGLVGPLEGYDPFTDSRIIIFFYVMIRREVFERVGLLDEIFSPGGCEDIDFSFRAKLAGYKCIQATEVEYRPDASTNRGGVPIWHKDNQTFGKIPEYKKTILRKNNLINARRWHRNIKLSVGPSQFKYQIDPNVFFPITPDHPQAVFWMPEWELDFDSASVTELLCLEYLETIDKTTRTRALQNWNRILRHNGQLVIEFLDIEKVVPTFFHSDKPGQQALYEIIADSRGGLLSSDLEKNLKSNGFDSIVFSNPIYSHPQIYTRVVAKKLANMSVDWPSIKSQDPDEYQEIIEINGYGLEKSDVEDRLVLDIGGNIGMFSLLAAANGARRIVAVEPQIDNFKQLSDNIKNFNQIVAVNQAVYSQDNITVNINKRGSTSSIYGGGDPVTTISLETLITKYNLNEENMILKIDCEGAEFDIIPFVRDDILSKFSIVMMEIHTANCHPDHNNGEAVYEKLRSLNFEMVRSLPLINYATGEILGTYVQKWIRR